MFGLASAPPLAAKQEDPQTARENAGHISWITFHVSETETKRLFAIGNEPQVQIAQAFLNGILLTPDVDYSLKDGVLTMARAIGGGFGEILTVFTWR